MPGSRSPPGSVASRCWTVLSLRVRGTRIADIASDPQIWGSPRVDDDRNGPGAPVLSSFVFFDTTGFMTSATPRPAMRSFPTRIFRSSRRRRRRNRYCDGDEGWCDDWLAFRSEPHSCRCQGIAKPMKNMVRTPQVALPHCQHAPTLGLQRGCMLSVTNPRSCELWFPIPEIGLG